MALLWVSNCGVGRMLQFHIDDPMPTAACDIAALKKMGSKGAYRGVPKGAKCVKCGHDGLLKEHDGKLFCAEHVEAELRPAGD